MLNSVGLQGPGIAAWLERRAPCARALRRQGGRQHLGAPRRGLRRCRRAARRRAAVRGGGGSEHLVSKRRGPQPDVRPFAERATKVLAATAALWAAPLGEALAERRQSRRDRGCRARWRRGGGHARRTPCSAWRSTSLARRPVLGAGWRRASPAPRSMPVACRAVYDCHRRSPFPTSGDRRCRRCLDRARTRVELLLAGAKPRGAGGDGHVRRSPAPLRILRDEASHAPLCEDELIGALQMSELMRPAGDTPPEMAEGSWA